MPGAICFEYDTLAMMIFGASKLNVRQSPSIRTKCHGIKNIWREWPLCRAIQIATGINNANAPTLSHKTRTDLPAVIVRAAHLQGGMIANTKWVSGDCINHTGIHHACPIINITSAR